MKTLQELQKELEIIEDGFKNEKDQDIRNVMVLLRETIKQKISQLTPKINRNEAGLFVPDEGQDIYYFTNDNNYFSGTYEGTCVDMTLVKIGNCYPDEASIEKAQLRRESMIPTYLPKKKDRYLLIYLSDYGEGWKIMETFWDGDLFDWFNYHLGLIYHINNLKGAEEWIVKNSDAWMGL